MEEIRLIKPWADWPIGQTLAVLRPRDEIRADAVDQGRAETLIHLGIAKLPGASPEDDAPVSAIAGVGGRTAEALSEIGIETVADLKAADLEGLPVAARRVRARLDSGEGD